MAATEVALGITDAYRKRTIALRDRARAIAIARWPLIDAQRITESHAAYRQLVVPSLAVLQAAGARLSVAYVAAYLTAELDEPVRPVGASATAVAPGRSRTGKTLAESVDGSRIAALTAIKDGTDAALALVAARDRTARNAAEDVMFAIRATLDTTLIVDPRIGGWRRVTSGGCGACLGATDGIIHRPAALLRVHDSCSCTKEPVVRDVGDRVRRPTGTDIFAGLALDEQDRLLGPEKAGLIRSGAVPLRALVERIPLEALPDGITERPLNALAPAAEGRE